MIAYIIAELGGMNVDHFTNLLSNPGVQHGVFCLRKITQSLINRNQQLGFCTLHHLYFRTKMVLINASFFPLKGSVSAH